MTKAGIGLSEDANPATAANQAARAAMAQLGEIRADAVLLFASPQHFSEYSTLYKVIHTVCGTDAIVGCSGTGVLTAHDEIEEGPAVAVLAIVSEQLQIRPFLIEHKANEPSVVETAIRPL